jgi:hypothetical protein
MVVENSIRTFSQEYSSILLPLELESDGAHPTEWTFDHKGFFVLIVNYSPLPLHLLLITAVIVVVDGFSWRREVLLQAITQGQIYLPTKVIELLFQTHLFDMTTVMH